MKWWPTWEFNPVLPVFSGALLAQELEGHMKKMRETGIEPARPFRNLGV